MTSIEVYAQKESQFLFEKGFGYYCGVNFQDSTDLTINIDFDSSLIYLHRLNRKFPNYRRSETLDYISRCYFVKKDYAKSLKYALKVLSDFKSNNIEDDNYCFECNSACDRIGYIYQTQNNFEKALAYYDSSLIKYTTLPPICSISYYFSQVPRDYNLFLCYKGLGQNKKAIEILTPYIFDSTLNDYLDSTIINDYVNFILSLYTKAEIKKNIESSFDSLHYDADITKSENSSRYNFSLNCWLNLFDTKIFLVHGISWSDETDKIDSWLSKESQIEKVKNSVGFKRLFVP